MSKTSREGFFSSRNRDRSRFGGRRCSVLPPLSSLFVESVRSHHVSMSLPLECARVLVNGGCLSTSIKCGVFACMNAPRARSAVRPPFLKYCLLTRQMTSYKKTPIFSKTIEEHEKHLHWRQCRLHVKLSNCFFFRGSAHFLGHVLDGDAGKIRNYSAWLLPPTAARSRGISPTTTKDGSRPTPSLQHLCISCSRHAHDLMLVTMKDWIFQGAPFSWLSLIALQHMSFSYKMKFS